MNDVGKQLLERIQREVQLVKIPADQQDRVVEVIVSTLIKIITDPAIYSTLQPVLELQAINRNLQEQNQVLQQTLHAVMRGTVAVQVRKTPAKLPKKTPARKAVAKKPPKVQVKGSTAVNRKAFRQGFSGR